MFLFTSEALDRLSREHVRKAITMFNRLLDAGIDIVTLADGRRYRADAVGFEAAIDIALSAFSFGTGNEESSKKSFRGTANWVEKRRQASDDKTPMTSLTPGWLSLDKETMKFVPIGDRVETLVAIFERAAAGAGKRTIAREFAHLERWGHRTLYESYIGKLLVDRRVLGEFQPGTRPKGGRWSSAGDPIPDFYPRVIADDLWWRVRHARAGHVGGGGKSDAFRSIFRGMTYCGVCSPKNRKPVGMAYVSKGRNARSGQDKLVCSLALRGKCDHTMRYVYNRLEVAALSWLGRHAAELLGSENARRLGMRKELDVHLGQIGELQKEQQYWLDVAKDRATAAIVGEQLARIEKSITEVRRVVSEKETEIRGTPVHLDVGQGMRDLDVALRSRSTPDERRRLNEHLRRLISRIDFMPADTGGATVVARFRAGGEATWFLPA